jgi:hypothetical protein
MERIKKAKQGGAKHGVRYDEKMKQYCVQRYWEAKNKNLSITISQCHAMLQREEPENMIISLKSLQRAIADQPRRAIADLPHTKLETHKPELWDGQVVYPCKIVYRCGCCVDTQIEAKKEQKKLAKEQSKKDYGGPCSTDGESDNESAGSFKKMFGFQKKKPRAEFQAEIDDLKVQLANTQEELERARNKVNRYQQWARQAPL